MADLLGRLGPVNKRTRIRRFLLWLLPERRVRLAPERKEGPQELGGWSDLPYE